MQKTQTLALIALSVLGLNATRAQTLTTQPDSTQPQAAIVSATQPDAASTGIATTNSAPTIASPGNASTEPSPPIGGLTDSIAPDAAIPAATEPSEAVAPATNLLGGIFTSQSAGIRFRPPLGATQATASPLNAVVEFDNPDRDWRLLVTRSHLAIGSTLADRQDAKNKTVPGVLTKSVNQLKLDFPAADVLDQEIISSGIDGKTNMGKIAIQFLIGVKPQLRQQAIVQGANDIFYVFDFTTPGGDPAHPTPELQRVADTFTQLINSIDLLDQSVLVDDQHSRVIRTRALFANWTETKLKSVLIPEQWQRTTRDGKDTGYSYIVESADVVGDKTAVKIGNRYRRLDPVLGQIDGETWMTCTIDRAHESWTDVFTVVSPKGVRENGSEVGTSDQSHKIVADLNPDGTPTGTAHEALHYALEVNTVNQHSALPPVRQDLPPFYLPQALYYLLPRIVPLNEPKTYLFYVWAPNQRSVMLLYCEVLPRKTTFFNGQRVDAVEVDLHFGLDAPKIRTFMTPEGDFLGREVTYQDPKTQDPVTEMTLPTDAATLQKIWVKPDLSRPSGENSLVAPSAGSQDNSTPSPAMVNPVQPSPGQ